MSPFLAGEVDGDAEGGGDLLVSQAGESAVSIGSPLGPSVVATWAGFLRPFMPLNLGGWGCPILIQGVHSVDLLTLAYDTQTPC